MLSVGYLITLYNKAAYLPSVIKGLDAQKGKFKREFVFVDDGSTDHTIPLLKELTKDWENVTIITQSNKGPSSAFNKGLSYISADYLKPLDGDDILPPYATQFLLDGLKTHPSASLSFGTQSYKKNITPCDKEWTLISNPLLHSYRRAQILSPSAWLAKTDLVKKVGGCDEGVFVQDYSLELKLSLTGPFSYSKEPVYISPADAPGRLSENAAQTLHDLNLALANLCASNKVPCLLKRKIYQRTASRSLRWARRHKKSNTLQALYLYIKSIFKITAPTDKEIEKTCQSFQQSHTIRLPKKKSQPKVIHLVSSGNLRGGTEVIMLRVIKALKEHGINQLVIARSDGLELKKELLLENIPTVLVSQKKRNIVSKLKIWFTFHKFSPQLSMSWLPRAAQKIPKGPWIKISQVNWHQGMLCYKNSDALVVPSLGVKKHMEKQTKKPVYILPHFTDHCTNNPTDKIKKKDPPILLCLGRFDKVKGFDLAIKALQEVPNAILWIVGEGEEELALKTLTKDLNLQDRVLFFPWTQDITHYLDKASVLIVPSRQEALGLVILEAWQQKVPVVATKVDGPLYLIEDMVDGCLAETENHKDIALKINTLLENVDLYNNISKNALSKLKKLHTKEATGKAYIALFKELGIT